MVVFFFFQAEDGIRDTSVTGVQTCALPISTVLEALPPSGKANARQRAEALPLIPMWLAARECPSKDKAREPRSEERRVGKECRYRGTPQPEKKKRVLKERDYDSRTNKNRER